jgi:hypothetical protein
MPAANAAEATFQDRVLAVEVYRSLAQGMSLYDATRYAWGVNLGRVSRVDYVLAVKDREIIGVFEPVQWLPATPANFPNLPPAPSDRFGFIGRAAPPNIQARYIGHLVPAKKRGEQRDFHYHGGAYTNRLRR